MRNGLILVAIAFAVALAVIVGNRLSNEAMAVVVGAVCGISASIPVSVALVIAASKNWGREQGPREIGFDYQSHRYAPQPPQILVVSPPQQNASAYPYSSAPREVYLPPIIDDQGHLGDPRYSPRQFKIIGDE